MSSKPPLPPTTVPTPPADFSCASGEEQRGACNGQPRFGDYEGQSYCVLHYPAKDKLKEFNEAVDQKLKVQDFNFKGVWFPENISFTARLTKELDHSRIYGDASFSEAFFSDDVDFSDVTFMNQTDFSNATFQGNANFNDGRFRDVASFSSARFLQNADFLRAIFKRKADFRYSEFCAEANFDTKFNRDVDFLYVFFRGEAYFRYANFKGQVNFRSATFKDYLRFGGPALSRKAVFDFQHARIDKPDRVAFNNLALRPHWFVNVNARKFDFVNVDWQWKTFSIESEVYELEKRKVAAAHRMLAIALRSLALNAEENERFEEASQFRYFSSQLWRKNEPHDYLTSFISWLYWAGSGYGERVFRALVVLAAIWLLFALLYSRGSHYTQVGFGTEPTSTSSTKPTGDSGSPPPAPLSFLNSLIYSLNVMTLQKPEPNPITSTAKGLVVLETIIGPIQAALLVLAIRRKFMR